MTPEIMAAIVAKPLVKHIERMGFVKRHAAAPRRRFERR
jgi:hypothetical protein